MAGNERVSYNPINKVTYEPPKGTEPIPSITVVRRMRGKTPTRQVAAPVRYSGQHTPPQGSTFNTSGLPGTQDYPGEGYNQWVAEQEAAKAFADQAAEEERRWHQEKLQADYARKQAAQYWADQNKGKPVNYNGSEFVDDYRFDKRVDQLRKLYELNSKKWGDQGDPEATSEKFFLRESSNAYSDQGDDGGGGYYPYYYGGYGGGGGGYSYTPQPAKMPAWFMNLLNWDI